MSPGLRRLFKWSIASRRALASAASDVGNREGSLSRRDCRKEDIEMKADTKSRHRNSAGGNVFIDLGFAPKEAKRLLAHAAAAEVLHVTRTRVSDVVNH